MADAVRILKYLVETLPLLELLAGNARTGMKAMGDFADDTQHATAILALLSHPVRTTTGNFRASAGTATLAMASDLMAAKLTGPGQIRLTVISTVEMAFVSFKTPSLFASVMPAGQESTVTNEEILASQTRAFTMLSARQSTEAPISNAHARMSGRVKFATFQPVNAAVSLKNRPGRLIFLLALISTRRIHSAFGVS